MEIERKGNISYLDTQYIPCRRFMYCNLIMKFFQMFVLLVAQPLYEVGRFHFLIYTLR